MCSKMHETSVQILSNLLFNPPELTLRNLFLRKRWAFKPLSATPQSPWHLHTFALTRSSPQGFHRTEWSVPWRRSHLRLEGRSTWLPKISRDTRCKNIKNVYAICSEWQRHQTSQKSKFLPLPRSFRGSSTELPQISYNEMDVSFNMQFLYFLEGQLLIARIFKYKNEISREWKKWRKRLHSICFRELPPKKTQKAFRGLPRLQSGTIFQVLWHNPAYHYVENKWRCSSVVPDPKSISRRLQSPQTCGDVPSNSRGAFQRGTSALSCRGPLDGDVSARVVEVFIHPDCTCGAQRQNYDLIAEMQLRPHSGDPSFQDWRCSRQWEHATCNTGRITSPQFCNFWILSPSIAKYII